jgi:hypothetical protein
MVTGDVDVGGLAGIIINGTVEGCFWDVNTSGTSDGVGNVDPDPNGVMGRTTAQVMMLLTFTNAGWDFNDVWAICEGTNYPRLQWQIPAVDFVCPDGVTFPDYSFFSTWWLRDDCSINNDCDDADIDFSGAVDIADLQVFCNYWLEGI